MPATNEEMERAVRIMRDRGFDVTSDRAVMEHDGWMYGEAVTLLSDTRDGMYSAGEEGFVYIEEVGGEEYGNVRTVICFVPEGSNVGDEADPSELESRVAD